MNRVERVNCACLAAIVLVLTLLLGSYTQPANSATPAPEAAEVSVSVDSESAPSGVRGMTEGELLRDAWTSYKVVVPVEPTPSGQFATSPEYFAAYEGSAPEFTAGYFAIESKQFPGLFHAFHMVAAQRA